MTGKSLDGLTLELLRTTRAAWWDDAFTRALLEPLPETARAIVDVGCGLGQAALAILPLRPCLRWIGVDADRARLTEARRALSAAGLDGRTSLVHARAEALPLAAACADAVLFVATLQHVEAAASALTEAQRVLLPGGTLVAVEPDNLGQHHYLDGPLGEVDAAHRALQARARAARHPRDSAIGPRVPALARDAGLADVAVRVHLVQVVRWEKAADWCIRKREEVRHVAGAGGLDPACPEVADCDRALARAVEAVGPERVACAVGTVPMFVVSGVRR